MNDSTSEVKATPTLARSSCAFARWYLAVASDVFRRAPSFTTRIVIYRTLSQFGQMFAFFLPLKVLLLLGSDGVPKYFRFFIEPSDKEQWVIILATLTPVIYFSTLILAAWSRKLATKGEGCFLTERTGRRLSPSGNRRQNNVRRQYEVVCQTYSDAAITFLGVTALVLLNSFVASCVVVWYAIQFLLTNYLLQIESPALVKGFGTRIRRRPELYIQYSVEIGFLVLFGMILIDYAAASEMNVIVAILTLLLGRRTFPAMGRYLRRSVQLGKRRRRVVRTLGVTVTVQ
jgi:hypothetical protein